MKPFKIFFSPLSLLDAYLESKALDSKYASSKLSGEKNILKGFNKALILRPSIVYSVDDNFSTMFMTILNRLPIFPLYYGGNTKFTPIHCSDLTDVILNIICLLYTSPSPRD